MTHSNELLEALDKCTRMQGCGEYDEHADRLIDYARAHLTQPLPEDVNETDVVDIPQVAENKENTSMSGDDYKCPECGGEADNGVDRCHPPNVYLCTKCEHNSQAPSVEEALDEMTRLAQEMREYDYPKSSVDVKALKKMRNPIYPPLRKAHVEGWNDCIDHLASQGYITPKKED